MSSDVAPTVVQREKQPEEYAYPTVDDIEKIANATKNYRDEFLVWFLQSTGVRRRTVPKLTFGDLRKIVHVGDEMKVCPLGARVEGEIDALVPFFLQIGSERLKGRYRGVQQICFLHFKCYQKYSQYVKWLQNESIPIAPSTPIFMKLKKPHTALKHGSIRNIIVDASIDAFGNGKVFTPHDLRRHQQTQLEKARIPDNWIKKLQGKKLKREQSPYSLPKIQDLHKAFKDSVSYFVPTTEPQPQEHLAKRITDQDKQIKEQQETLTKIERIITYSLERHRFISREAEEQCLKEIAETKKPLNEIINKYAIPEENNQ